MLRSSIPFSLSKPYLDYTSSFAHLHLCRSQQLHPAVTPLTICNITVQRRKPVVIQSTSTCLPLLFPSCPFYLPFPSCPSPSCRLPSCSSPSSMLLLYFVFGLITVATSTSHAYTTPSGNTHSIPEAARSFVKQATISLLKHHNRKGQWLI